MPRLAAGAHVTEEPELRVLRPVPDHLSHSQITSLVPRYRYSCARRWAYRTLMGLSDEDQVSYLLVVGKILDEAVTAMLTQRRIVGYTSGPDELAFNNTLDAGIAKSARATDDWVQWPVVARIEDYERVTREAAALCYVSLADVQPDHIQTKHEWHARVEPTDPNSAILTDIGYSDWIDTDGVVNDLKIRGKNPVNKAGEWERGWVEPIRQQMTGYYVARRVYAVKLGIEPPPPLARIHVITHNTNLKNPAYNRLDLELDDEDVRVLMDDAREAYRRQHAATHPPSPGDACQSCSFRVRCHWDSARFAPLTVELSEATH